MPDNGKIEGAYCVTILQQPSLSLSFRDYKLHFQSVFFIHKHSEQFDGLF